MANSATAKAEGTRRIAIIDADTIIFARTVMAERKVTGAGLDGETVYLQTQSLEQVYEQVVERIENLLLVTEADDAIICLSDSKNFRYDILPSYKSNRHGSRRPPLLVAVRETLQDRKPFPVMVVETLEADDVCGIAAGTLTKGATETVICSPDKDLRSIPGLYFACRNDSKVERITQEEADRFHLYQTLIGDTTDCYVGLPKVGPVKANAILDGLEGLSEGDRWNKIVEEFVNRGYDARFALTQARVARILRASDWNAEKREVILWEPKRESCELATG